MYLTKRYPRGFQSQRLVYLIYGPFSLCLQSDEYSLKSRLRTYLTSLGVSGATIRLVIRVHHYFLHVHPFR